MAIFISKQGKYNHMQVHLRSVYYYRGEPFVYLYSITIYYLSRWNTFMYINIYLVINKTLSTTLQILFV